MTTIEDKGKTTTYDHSDILGEKPYGSIGPDRTTEETKSVVNKLKKKKAERAEGSTQESGEEANAGKIAKSIGNFVNR